MRFTILLLIEVMMLLLHDAVLVLIVFSKAIRLVYSTSREAQSLREPPVLLYSKII